MIVTQKQTIVVRTIKKPVVVATIKKPVVQIKGITVIKDSTTTVREDFYQTQNRFSELDTEQKKAEARANLGIGILALRLETAMQAGVLTYQLPSLPLNSVQAFINGIQVDCTVNGVNLTITSYTAGEIDDNDFLKVFY